MLKVGEEKRGNCKTYSKPWISFDYLYVCAKVTCKLWHTISIEWNLH